MPTGAYSFADIDRPQGTGKFSLADVEENHTNPAAIPERHFWQPGMQPSEEDKFLSTEMSNAWDTIKGLPGSIKEAFTAPPTPQEAKQYGIGNAFTIPSVGLGPKQVISQPPNMAEQAALGIGRTIGQPIQNAAEWYANEYRLKNLPTPPPGDIPTLEKMGSVSAEGLGQAAGNVILGKALPAIGERLKIGKGATFSSDTPLSQAVQEAIPSVRRAGTGLQTLAEANKDVVPDPTKSYALAKAMSDHIAEYGGPALPDSLSRYLGRVMGEKVTGSMTFDQMWHSLRAINDALYVDKSVPKSLFGDTKFVAGQIANDLQAAADKAGFGTDWSKMTDEYHSAMKIKRTAAVVGPILGAIFGYKFGGELGAPVGARFLAGYAGKEIAKPYGAKAVGAVLNRQAGPPTLESIPKQSATMPSIPTSPQEYTRTLLQAKEGTISPGEADRRISKGGGSTKVNRLTPPPESTQ